MCKTKEKQYGNEYLAAALQNKWLTNFFFLSAAARSNSRRLKERLKSFPQRRIDRGHTPLASTEKKNTETTHLNTPSSRTHTHGWNRVKDWQQSPNYSIIPHGHINTPQHQLAADKTLLQVINLVVDALASLSELTSLTGCFLSTFLWTFLFLFKLFLHLPSITHTHPSSVLSLSYQSFELMIRWQVYDGKESHSSGRSLFFFLPFVYNT